ncbi:expressed unknown protein [Seminavis robusta]|uniref:Uncharacterized protein n=1 Tax=Seminavis robusta TaxID=568900 RepID=A0A9N8HAV9_9STRA|nr:expressed unknown protein [Seminavis robusta]|eukprot:Sro255_g100491.1  (100) ;mRNA; f:78158-78457
MPNSECLPSHSEEASILGPNTFERSIAALNYNMKTKGSEHPTKAANFNGSPNVDAVGKRYKLVHILPIIASLYLFHSVGVITSQLRTKPPSNGFDFLAG